MLECLLCLVLSPHLNTYESTIRTEPGIHVAVADPLYLWGSYEAPDLRLVGQYMPAKVAGGGLGYRLKFERAAIFVEAGYYWPEVNPLEVVKDEVVEQILINDHGDPGWHADTFIYKLSAGWGGRIGVDVEVTSRTSVWAAYRFLQFNEHVAMCEGTERCKWPDTTNAGLRHWVNADTQSFSSLQVGVSLKI